MVKLEFDDMVTVKFHEKYYQDIKNDIKRLTSRIKPKQDILHKVFKAQFINDEDEIVKDKDLYLFCIEQGSRRLKDYQMHDITYEGYSNPYEFYDELNRIYGDVDENILLYYIRFRCVGNVK